MIHRRTGTHEHEHPGYRCTDGRRVAGRGFFAPNGIEFPLVLPGGALALAVGGAGAWSVDAVLAQRSTTT